MRPDEAPITRAELVEMFGTDMPIEAVQALCDAGDGRTIDQVRAEIRRLGTLRRREREEAEAARKIENRWINLLHEFADAVQAGEPEPVWRVLNDRIVAFEAEHAADVHAIRQRYGFPEASVAAANRLLSAQGFARLRAAGREP